MISIKRYLDAKGSEQSTPEADAVSAVVIECFRAALLATGKAALQVSSGAGEDLLQSLSGLERRLSVGYTAQSVQTTEKQFEALLSEWGTATSSHFDAQAKEVKELLVTLAKTAESVASRDECYSGKFGGLTSQLEKIANLNDLTLIRSSIVEQVGGLKATVNQMTQESRQLVARLQAEVSTYETRLRSVEQIALKDQLTQIANRRSVEHRIQYNIDNSLPFCLAMFDLNRFKQVNDMHGHQAGDDLLKQFSAELQIHTRSGDLVGRWGGDEFVVVLSCDVQAAKAHVERTRKWVFGKYTIRGAKEGSIAVEMDASIGVAEWQKGTTAEQLIAEADAEMYRDKKHSRHKAS
jgi:diguanylate cyclase (GGDEF)-like protein